METLKLHVQKYLYVLMPRDLFVTFLTDQVVQIMSNKSVCFSALLLTMN